MDKPEVGRLLALAAAMDRRTVGPTDVEAWHLILHGIGFAEAAAALSAHYATTERWAMPSDIASRVRASRNVEPPPSSGKVRCPWRACNCTHDGCTAGWLDEDDDKGRVRACPTCRPEVAEHLRYGVDDKSTRDGLRWLVRPSRVGP